MNNIFKNAGSYWVKYDRYEWKEANTGTLFLTPAKNSELKLYNPMENYREMILDALNVGMLCMNKDTDKEEIKTGIFSFVEKYGLLGFMTALPTTPDFITYSSVYLPKNHYIKKERLSTQEFLSYFFPFEKIDFVKKRLESSWSVTDTGIGALILTMKHMPQAVLMSFQKEYAERLDWLINAFSDLAFTFFSSFLYYQDFDVLDQEQKDLYRKGMSAFGGVAPTYHIELREKPTIIWEFNSLLLQIQMMLSLMITDEDSTIRVCKNCGRAFISRHKNADYCSKECRDEFKNR